MRLGLPGFTTRAERERSAHRTAAPSAGGTGTSNQSATISEAEREANVAARKGLATISRASGLAYIAILACAAWPVGAQRLDPVDDLRQYVLRFTGAEPIECGRHLLVQREREWVAAAETVLRESVACGERAALAQRAFWTFKQEQGIDSWVATGILGTGDGTIYRFSYDSAPCGGPSCASRISFERCAKPVAATAAYQRSEFRCAR
jgi:hypothetical protein